MQPLLPCAGKEARGGEDSPGRTGTRSSGLLSPSHDVFLVGPGSGHCGHFPGCCQSPCCLLQSAVVPPLGSGLLPLSVVLARGAYAVTRPSRPGWEAQ